MQKLDPKNLSLEERVEVLNKMILEGKSLEAFEKFYAEDVTMQENEVTPTEGKNANRSREEEFATSITAFRHAAVKNVIISDHISVVEWELDYTHKDWGDIKHTQVSVQRWNKEGLIVRENFYYNN